jgi:hypothetical protein
VASARVPELIAPRLCRFLGQALPGTYVRLRWRTRARARTPRRVPGSSTVLLDQVHRPWLGPPPCSGRAATAARSMRAARARTRIAVLPSDPPRSRPCAATRSGREGVRSRTTPQGRGGETLRRGLRAVCAAGGGRARLAARGGGRDPRRGRLDACGRAAEVRCCATRAHVPVVPERHFPGGGPRPGAAADAFLQAPSRATSSSASAKRSGIEYRRAPPWSSITS